MERNPPGLLKRGDMNERKAAQLAALFLLKAGGAMPHLKLMKLLYIADRESYKRHGLSMTGDEMVSMPNGPVLSRTLDLMREKVASAPDGWSTYVQRRGDYEVTLAEGVTSESSFDLFSRANREVIGDVWEEYGGVGKWELARRTHTDEFPEWEDPQGSSKPIDLCKLFVILGMSEEEARALKEENEELDAIDAYFDQLRSR